MTTRELIAIVSALAVVGFMVYTTFSCTAQKEAAEAKSRDLCIQLGGVWDPMQNSCLWSRQEPKP